MFSVEYCEGFNLTVSLLTCLYCYYVSWTAKLSHAWKYVKCICDNLHDHSLYLRQQWSTWWEMLSNVVRQITRVDGPVLYTTCSCQISLYFCLLVTEQYPCAEIESRRQLVRWSRRDPRLWYVERKLLYYTFGKVYIIHQSYILCPDEFNHFNISKISRRTMPLHRVV